MNPAALELALKKQRLLIACDGLRADFAGHAKGLAPAFGAADCVVEGAHWLRKHPQPIVAAVVALLVIRPKRAWLWARRGFFAWQAWRKLSGFLEQRPTA